MTTSPVLSRRRRARPAPLVGIIMGSRSDWPTLAPAARLLAARGIPCEVRVVSAHRTPALLYRYARGAARRGLRCLIAGAGGAAHLPGMAAALTPLPVLGVPVRSRALDGWDSLLSILQMPAGIPVATFRVGPEGAADAARFAAVLATGWPPDGNPPPALPPSPATSRSR